MPLEQLLAAMVLVAALVRMAWLVARPPHHTEASWSRAQARVDDWLARHAHPRV